MKKGASTIVLAMGLVAVLAIACGSTGVVHVDRTAVCTGNPRTDLCEQAYDAVVAELDGLPPGSRVGIDPVQCANDRCWTFVTVTPASGGPAQELSVDWAEDGQISVGHVVPAG